MDYGKVVRRTGDDYVVGVDPDIPGSGYNVVPKDVDPSNRHDIDAVREYVAGHPQMVVADYAESGLRLAREARALRDSLIASVEWRARRYRDELLLGVGPTEDILPVLRYIQALRDVPQQEGFPEDIVWPTLGGADE
ncbi:MAG: hypothetical protein CVV48_06510 [Spirochaetae bacterium HGW-Spirochaetae-4]|nr:MAG: hypothetical protein CVV48_06510 [Spirochaetae bacterium HGW-Spirochaetae-4]